MKKKGLSMFLALVICLGLLPTAALAAAPAITLAVKCKYDYVRDFSEGLAAVRIEDQGWSYIDKTGKEVIPCKYQGAQSFSDGRAVVWVKDQGCGVIDAAGNVVIPFGSYSSIGNYSDGLAVVRDANGGYGVIDTDGKVVIPLGKYTSIEPYSEGLAVVSAENGDDGVVDASGREVVPCKYDTISGPYSDGLVVIGMYDDANGAMKYGYMDKSGNEVTPIQYDDAETFSNGRGRVRKDDPKDFVKRYVGFVDSTGKEVIPLTYGDADNFVGGLAGVRVQDGGWWGIIDVDGNEVYPMTLKGYAGLISRGSYDGIAIVSVIGDNHGLDSMPLLSAWGIIDKNGQVLLAPAERSWIHISFSNEDYATVLNDSKERVWIYQISTGKELAKFNGCMEVGKVREGMLAVQNTKGKWGYVSINSAPAITSTGENPKDSGQSYAATQTIDVGGKAVSFQMYALKDENGDPTNYVKLRDLADVLDGTAAQFNVTWSKEEGVGIETGTAYTSRNGTEGNTPYSGDMPYQKGAATTQVDGQAVPLQAFVLTDPADGGQTTYYKLRDLGQALGFNVGWSSNRGVFVEPDKAYDADN